MAGYIHDPLQIINLIADNLRDRYKSGFPVLKEIIQNADDAGTADESIQLEFGLSPGIPAAQHPLLKGPGLYFINSGDFKDSDNLAIRSFGLNRKAVEQSSIGKFGLGMKSVFHFCEAFFFLARNREKEYAEILNPWSSSEEFVSHHVDWDNFSLTDGELIVNQVRAVLDAMDLARNTFFLLWLPLRKKEHLHTKDGKIVGSIINEFPGDTPSHLDFLHEPDLPQRIASLMPLLRRITQIRFWDGAAAPVFEVMLDPRSKRISRDLEQAHTGREMWGAAIYSRREEEKKSFTSYTGHERLVATPEFLALKQSTLWPKTFVRNESGESEEAPDKAQGHCAAVFSSSDERGTGRFIINWAVFLPIGEKRNETKRCGGNRTFRLTLHGYFFVDAGRADIEGFQDEGGLPEHSAPPANEAELRSLWNRRLARQGTLPLILPSLAGFVGRTRLSADDRWHLSQGLSESQTFRQYRRVICAQHSWVCRLTRKGKEWGLISPDQTMRLLPEPPASIPDRPWVTFPELVFFEKQNVVLLLKGAPHLHASLSLPQWEEKELLNLLQLDALRVFADQGSLDYLLAFLADDSVRPFLNTGELQACLQKIFKGAFGGLGTELRQHRGKVQEFVAFIHAKNRYPIKQDVSALIQQIQNEVSSVLILAGEFDAPEAAGTAKLTLDSALALLKKLHELIINYERQDDQETIKHCRDIAREILQGQSEEQRRAVLVQAGNLKILEGYDCIQKKLIALSPADLKNRHGARMLFSYSQGLKPSQWLGLAPKLQHAIKDRVILVKSGTAELVFDKNNDLLPCHADSVLESLGSNAIPLQPIEKRRQLLRDVAGADLEATSQVRGLRYLLHGQVEYFDDVEETLWVSGYDQSPVWGKLWQQLESHHKDGWNLLDRTLVEEIPQNKWLKLSIREIKPDNILYELRDAGAKCIRGAQFSRDERNAVLKELATDERLWRELPFHETVKEDLVSITTGRTFIETDIVLPQVLFQEVDIIKLSSDQTIKRQQKEWITPLSEHDVIRIALQHEEPVKFWPLIMDNLVVASNRLSQDLCRNTAWLPDNTLIPVKPSDVVYLKQMQDEVDRLLAVARGAFWSPGKLLDDLQQHPSFAFLKEQYFAVDLEGFEKLSLLLDETNQYHVGKIVFNDEDFDRIVPIFARLPAHLCLPGWGLLSCALEASQQWAREYILPQILQPIHSHRIIAILHWLKEEQTKAGSGKMDMIAAFNSYLSALVNSNCGIDTISQLPLLNRDGDWKPAGELCSEAEGVANSHLVDDVQKGILRHIIFHADNQHSQENGHTTKREDLKAEVIASADILESFLADFEGIVAPEIICAFLLLLGHDSKMQVLAEKYRGRRRIEWMREHIAWEEGIPPDKTWETNLSKTRLKYRFSINICNSTNIKTYSILGSEIVVPVGEELTNFVTGGIGRVYSKELGGTISITLRKTDVSKISQNQLSKIFQKTSEYLLKKVYGAIHFDLGSLWEELDRSDQLDIRIAQQLVLNHLPFYLPQLGVHKHPKLKDLLNQWDEARSKREEYYELREKREACDVEERQVLRKIQELLKSDEHVQAVVLQAVRIKMKDFQYSPASIPFELFQNADDAVVELAMMKAYPKALTEVGEEVLPDHVRRFEVIEQGSSLLIVHWGRPVNAVGSGGFPGRERGFHHDLEKMLVLSSSDKSTEGNVTGKFGLGFKSVLLACERPKLLSGRLATEIIAGLCPVPLEDSAQLRSKLHELSSDRRWQGTLLELPHINTSPREIMRSFSRLAGIMAIFSKQIRRVDIHGDSNFSWEWKPEKLSLNDDACLELAHLPLQDSLHQGRVAMYCRLNGGGILLSLGPDGFRPLPAELPGIWVVAPTKEIEGLGLAINCKFDLDAGRARLAGNSDVNKQKALYLGAAFGQALRLLFRLSLKKWDDLKAVFRFEEDLLIYDFWATFWKVIGESMQTRGSEEVGDLLVRLFCGDNGLGYLITHEDAMPNGLWEDYRCLTKPEKVRIVLKGSLEKAVIFNKIIEWQFFRDYLGTPESVISETVYIVASKVLPALGKAKTQWRSVQFADVLRNFAETENKITPETATTLGRLLNTEALKGQDFEKEKEWIEQALHFFLFKTQDGSFRVADEILVLQKHDRANSDEAKRAAFATPEYVLAFEYQGSGLNFFFSCREKISIPVEKMVQWLLDAKSDQHKSHGLRYLLNGDHGEKVAVMLREKGLVGTWLVELRPDSACFQGWEKEDIFEILYRKLPSIEELHRLHTETDENDAFPFEEVPFTLDPQNTLQRIHAWWLIHKEEYLKRYEKQTYPENLSLSFGSDDLGRIDRNSWLALFSLAHFYTMGRQRDVQHKGFIERCQQKGWWNVFAKDNPQHRSDEWMRVLEEFIDEQVDESGYEHWMHRFPAIYKFSRWLEEYKEAFLSIDRQIGRIDISSLLRSRVNATFQGGGISAPPIDKSLGIGACFVLRELMRRKIFKTKKAAPFCYVPAGKLRWFFKELGCDTVMEGGGINNAKEIHNFVCKHIGEKNATFADCYDIPFLFIFEDQDLQNRLFIQ